MNGNEIEKYSKPALVYHFINWCTYLVWRVIKILSPSNNVIERKAKPVLITGLFRSGTTITARIINDLGYSAGPTNHLLIAKGARRELNPDGFLENYFFMDLSMYLFFKTNSWGDNPPTKTSIENINITKTDDAKMAFFSVVKLHDDRISNINKVRTLLCASVFKPEAYIENYFTGKAFIKNPHFALQLPYLKKIFPNSKIVVVYRNPVDAVASAKKVTPNVDYKLYNSYYTELFSEYKVRSSEIIFFSYDNLISNTQASVKALADALGVDIKHKTFDYVRQSDGGARAGDIEILPEETKKLFDFMNSNCINPN